MPAGKNLIKVLKDFKDLKDLKDLTQTLTPTED